MDLRRHSLVVSFFAAAVMTSVLSGCKEDKKVENEAKETPATQQEQQGMSGMSGQQGMSGMDGQQGMSGMSGQQGMSGMDGQQGMSGEQPAAGDNTGN